MAIKNPQLSKTPHEIDDFRTYAIDSLYNETQVTDITCLDQEIDAEVFQKIEIKNSIFKNCTFQTCNFENASFIDVVFQSCNLSNSKFTGAYFERCQFIHCKCVGIIMNDTIIKQTTFEESNFKYSHFDESKITDVLFDQIDFTEASMTDTKLKRFEATASRFVKNNFHKTLLATVDFSNSEFMAPTVSDPPSELKGSTINLFQAADLIGLWGIIVKTP